MDNFWSYKSNQNTGIDKYLVNGNPDKTGHGPEFFTLSAIIVGFSYLVIVGFVTQIYYGLYVYRNLFTDQGYLTLTLPASANAKEISCIEVR